MEAIKIEINLDELQNAARSDTERRLVDEIMDELGNTIGAMLAQIPVPISLEISRTFRTG